MPGTFIVLDGPDASGTTTHVKLLAERLKKEGHDVLVTSEPTDGPIGMQIRHELRSGSMDPMELQKLFTNDRAWHVEHVIVPALNAGKTVVCDRYIPSTIIYAETQGIPSAELKELNKNFPQPDCTIFTLPPLEVSFKRMAKRESKEHFEREDFQRKIHDGYARMAAQDSSISVADTSGDKQTAAEEMWSIIQPCLQRSSAGRKSPT